MTETEFIQRNHGSWRALERLLLQKTKDADKLQSLFVKVSSDLSYARTFFPNRSVRLYLNNLTLQVFSLISEKRSKHKFSDLLTFFRETLPIQVYENRRIFLISFLIFSVSILVGILSSIYNPDFANVILGDHYITMTENNINQGDPMAVYKDANEVDMFLGITVNNIRVAFLAFVLGLLGGIGTVFVLVTNGIMVGAFQYFFYSKGLFLTSFLTIWIHGALEISAIVISGAAGLILGNGLLFPRTHTRINALLISTEKALIVVLGTIPLFVMAGLLESFVTRLTDLPMSIKILIIGASFLFVLLMWVIYPMYYYYHNRNGLERHDRIYPHDKDSLIDNFNSVKSLPSLLSSSFVKYRYFLSQMAVRVILPMMASAAVLYWMFLKIYPNEEYLNTSNGDLNINTEIGFLILLFHWISISTILALLGLFYKNLDFDISHFLFFAKSRFFKISLVMFPIVLAFHILPIYWFIAFILVISPQCLVSINEGISRDNSLSLTMIRKNWVLSWSRYGHYILLILIIVSYGGMILLLFNSSLLHLLTEIFYWHSLFDSYIINQTFIYWLFNFIILLLITPLLYLLLAENYYSERCKREALDLKERFESFGRPETIFER